MLRKADSFLSEHSSVGSRAELLGIMSDLTTHDDDDDLDPDNKSALSADTYIITNVGKQKACCSVLF
jgi:hypothetical protein